MVIIMLKKEKNKIVTDFELKARPVELVSHIDNVEIISLLKDIKAELKILNKQ